jgi:hypothetical protein
MDKQRNQHSGMFTWDDVKNVQRIAAGGFPLFIGHRVKDGREYFVGISKYGRMETLTPEKLGRIAVY